MTRKQTLPAMQRVADIFADSFGFAGFELDIAPARKTLKNVTSHDISPKIEEGRAIFHVKKLKQNLAQTFESLYLVFNSWRDMASFSVPFRVNAHELDTDVEGTLEVTIKKGRAVVRNK